jgi:hypothetical protein
MIIGRVLNWLIHTRGGFITRLALGLAFFATLAIVDLRKRGRNATRWREYAFIVACVGVAILYGVVNDQVTSRISWEYFYYGKDLEKVLGEQKPPDAVALSREAAKIGMMATWAVGLLLGVAIVIANDPRRHRPQLPYRGLFMLLPIVLGITVAFAIIGGALGWFGWLNWIAEDFRDMWAASIWRPQHFMATYGAHLGGYVGGLIGGAWGVWRVIQLRRA